MVRRTIIIGLLGVAAIGPLPLRASVLHVDSNARGENTGTSWTDAFTNLQDALDAARPGFEIWVANGAYVPERDRDGVPTTGPEATFVLKSPSVKILGGFRGDESSSYQRNPIDNPTVLEGEGQKWHLVFVDDKFDVDASTRLDGFVIRGGRANGVAREDRFGGGMLVVNASVTIANCTFEDNYAEVGGGGLYHEGPGVYLVNCRFLRNSGGAQAAGGGVYIIGPAQIANCLFASNSLGAGGVGGGAALICTGGTACVEPTAFVASCTFFGNSIAGPSGSGGGLYATSHVQVVNSIVWGNQAATNRSIGFAAAAPQVRHSDVQDGFPGVGNLNADPLFANPSAANVRLNRHSPCVGAGNAAYLPLDFADLDGNGVIQEPLPLDLDLTPRIIESLNLGCYETFDCNANGVGDYREIERCGGDPACGDCNRNGIPDACDAAFSRLYVSQGAEGPQTGESWASAYGRLNDALCAAAVPGSQVREIWIRRGIYTPADYDPKYSDREATFRLLSGVAIYGGFAGTETELSQRDIVANRTVLSGDLAFNDGPEFVNNEENSLHVVVAENVDASAVLDGVTIFGGNATSPRLGVPLGGGLLAIDASPTIRNVGFLANYADLSGGGLAALGTSFVQLTNCFFARNGAPVGSALAGLGGGQARIVNSILRENGVLQSGAAVAVASDSRVEVESCTITQNFGHGGTSAGNGILAARNSIFWNNASPELRSIDGGFLAVTYCDVMGGFPGMGNLSADPLFVSPNGPDGEPGTLDDDLRLGPGSPCIDAGDPFSPPASAIDADGRLRVQQCRADIGAYESSLFADCDGNGLGDACEIAATPASDCNGDYVLDRCAGSFRDCNGDGIDDACQADSDGDGVIDACDGCPTDSAKTSPGTCGCGQSDVDTDGDGVPDCLDNCPTRPNPDQRDGNANGAGDACDSLLRFEGCPGDLQVASNDASGTTVSFSLPLAVDGYGEVTLSSTAEPGSFFAIGETVVTVTATDDAGGLATCSFLVTVLAPDGSGKDMPAEEDDCPPLYRANGRALRFFGFPFGCGPGCLAAMPLTLLGIAAMKRGGRRAARRNRHT